MTIPDLLHDTTHEDLPLLVNMKLEQGGPPDGIALSNAKGHRISPLLREMKAAEVRTSRSGGGVFDDASIGEEEEPSYNLAFCARCPHVRHARATLRAEGVSFEELCTGPSLLDLLGAGEGNDELFGPGIH